MDSCTFNFADDFYASPLCPKTPPYHDSQDMDVDQKNPERLDECAFAQGSKLFLNGNFKAAAEVFSSIQNKTPMLEHRLFVINPERSKKKCIKEKLARHFQYAQAQLHLEQQTIFEVHPLPISDELKIVQNELKVINHRAVGMVEFVGLRPTMEDATLITEFTFNVAKNQYLTEVYGVFDGHGGDQSVQFVSKNFSTYLLATLRKHNPNTLTDEGIYQALRECFIKLDEATQGFEDGTTASVAIILDGKLWVTNVGDSRAILSQQQIPVALSHDSKISEIRFQDKITKLGGTLLMGYNPPRVTGTQGIPRLSVAGALGDRYILGSKGKCCLPPQPQITCYPLNKNPSYLLLACDGYFDSFNTTHTVFMIHQLADQGFSVEKIVKQLANLALIKGSEDNISMILVRL